jgi:hypothetical protein
MSELGEGAATAAVKVDPDKYLKAEVLEVSFNNTYKACREQVTIKVPHWPAGSPDGDQQSKKAAVLQLGEENICTANVKVQIDSKGLSGKGTLTGTLKNLRFEGEIPLSSGSHEVTVTLKKTPDALSWDKGKMAWEIDAIEFGAIAGVTAVELFFVFDDPARRKFFNRKGVWIEALRFIFDKGKLQGTQKITEGLSKVTQCCFELPNHQYEIKFGAAKFGGASGKFQLTKYMDPKHGVVNCYDQTYAVITFAGALGLAVNGLFLQPFGFLKHTSLVGRGACNNPFPFSKQQGELASLSLLKKITSRKRPVLEDYLVVDVKDTFRSGFGNHMFCEFKNKIFDACSGAALGEHDRLGYMEHGIDIEPNIPLSMVAYYKGQKAPVSISIMDTGYPENSQALALNKKYCIDTITNKGLGIDSVS